MIKARPGTLPGREVLLQLFRRGNPFRAGKNSRENWPGAGAAADPAGAARPDLQSMAVLTSGKSSKPCCQPICQRPSPPAKCLAAQALALAQLGLVGHAHEGGFTD